MVKIMAKKEKKPLTSSQKQRKYRAIQYTTFGSEFLSILTPYIVMGGVNFDEWFVKNHDGWKIGLGGSLALAILGLATFLVGKKKEDEKITGGYITLTIGWFAVTFIFMLLSSIMDQISTIMFFGGLGLLGAFGLDITSKSFKKKADMYAEARKKVLGENIEKDIKKEIEEEIKKEAKSQEKKKVAID